MNKLPDSMDEYQKNASKTNAYERSYYTLGILTLGLTGEAGETADKIKKYYRDLNGESLSINNAYDIAQELGDVLWYLSQIALEIGFSLSDIALINQSKLEDREKRNKIRGNGEIMKGDNR